MNNMFSSSKVLPFSPLQRTAVAAALDACLQATPEDERSTVAIGFALMPPGAPFSGNAFACNSGTSASCTGASASCSGASDAEATEAELAQEDGPKHTSRRGGVLSQMKWTTFNSKAEKDQVSRRRCWSVDAADESAGLDGADTVGEERREKEEVSKVEIDTSICGRWSCGSQSYEIFEFEGKLFFDQGPIGSGELVLDGEWQYAQLAKSDGEVCGTIRLRYQRNYQNSDGEIMSNFQICGGSWGGDISATKVVEDGPAKERRMTKTPTKAPTKKMPDRVYVHPIIINLPKHLPGVTSESKLFSKMFEGSDAAMRAYIMPEEGKDIDVSRIARKGKKRMAAPMPEEFAKAIQKLVLKGGTEGSNRGDQDFTIKASQKYYKSFNKVQGLGEDKQFAPSLEGGVDAVVELLDDVRTGALNIFAFIFKRG